jgi:hypothetical protein
MRQRPARRPGKAPTSPWMVLIGLLMALLAVLAVKLRAEHVASSEAPATRSEPAAAR